MTGDALEYTPYQEAAVRFGEISVEQFQEAVQLIEPDGRVSRAAEAVCRSLRHAPGKRWMFWAYERVPGFATVSEIGYRFVARRRDTHEPCCMISHSQIPSLAPKKAIGGRANTWACIAGRSHVGSHYDKMLQRTLGRETA